MGSNVTCHREIKLNSCYEKYLKWDIQLTETDKVEIRIKDTAIKKTEIDQIDHLSILSGLLLPLLLSLFSFLLRFPLLLYSSLKETTESIKGLMQWKITCRFCLLFLKIIILLIDCKKWNWNILWRSKVIADQNLCFCKFCCEKFDLHVTSQLWSKHGNISYKMESPSENHVLILTRLKILQWWCVLFVIAAEMSNLPFTIVSDVIITVTS